MIFFFKFIVLFFVFVGIVHLLDTTVLESGIAALIADSFYLQYSANRIFVGPYSLVINKECSGMLSISIWLSLMLSLKMDRKLKIISIVLGSAALFTANIIRLYFVIGIATLFPYLIDAAHITSWFAMLFVILAIWFVIIRKKEVKIEL